MIEFCWDTLEGAPSIDFNYKKATVSGVFSIGLHRRKSFHRLQVNKKRGKTKSFTKNYSSIFGANKALREMMLNCRERCNLIIIKAVSHRDRLEICFCFADCSERLPPGQKMLHWFDSPWHHCLRLMFNQRKLSDLLERCWCWNDSDELPQCAVTSGGTSALS